VKRPSWQILAAARFTKISFLWYNVIDCVVVAVTARLFTPESAPVDLAVRRTANGRTEVVAPKLIAWGAVLLE